MTSSDARALGIAVDMAARRDRSLVADVYILPAEQKADAAFLRRAVLLASLRWCPS